MRTIVYIPTLNAGAVWTAVLAALNRQSLKPTKKVLVDSGSTDGTLSSKELTGFEVLTIDKKDFDHGGTRQLVINKFPDADIYIFLTQDAILADQYALEKLVQAFINDSTIGVAYGRQLPHKGAKTLEAHARLFNYPSISQIRSMDNASQYGIRTASCSNSFAAYSKEAFEQAGGFPSGTILGEDVIAAGRILLNGWKLAYVAEAAVYHSHDYTVGEEFRRYFDIGVFHRTNAWIFDHFGHADSEGFKYVKSELAYVLKHNIFVLPKSIFSIGAKWLGYKLGMYYKKWPITWNKWLSMHKAYWQKHRS
ncbi:glycosyltransferase family 2 protein [Olivibacter sp. SDN3]|uniref:glycosyltransferase family 2 protein n=1 Tax=Olivibacter sp. SDN3 TaxID=2764720 RepID=UPI0016514935|nr:glycosyltransferase [Olivibacter sp. SDN3]QNL52084.1 glycosyltransferase family 2 protein [Olivibacter sp. SDN3]